MAATFDRRLKAILEDSGCAFVRQAKGSHEIWHSPKSRRYFTLPSGIKSRHTANEVLKQAGLRKQF